MLLAITASRGAKQQEIANAIHAKMKKANDSQQYHVGHLADVRKEVQRKKHQ
jgi:hypothetical protein